MEGEIHIRVEWLGKRDGYSTTPALRRYCWLVKETFHFLLVWLEHLALPLTWLQLHLILKVQTKAYCTVLDIKPHLISLIVLIFLLFV